MNIHTIYKITHIPTGMSYIGYSGMVERRWKVYRKLKLGGTYKRKIERAIAKYGIDQFEFTILYQSLYRDHALDEMEDYFIREYDTLDYGYNMRVGGQWAHENYLTTEAIKAKISQRTRERMKCPEIRAKISAARLGTKLPETTKSKIADWSKSNPVEHQLAVEARTNSMVEYWKNPSDAHKAMGEKLRLANLGKVHTEETKAKISANNKSSVVWLLRWEGVYHLVKDNVNDYVDTVCPFRYPVVYTTLKKHPDYSDKTKLVWGIKGRGPSKGFEVVRIPESMLSMGSGLVDHLVACKAITDTTGLGRFFF